ncbi:hypothetical protein [Streptomyces sp. NBC_01262]|uniref:hypothetical protein n=1 Tax=Streptomyces sp. NBC_01262 TaxID=2903803 RepID=UPI003FCE70E2
MRQHAPADVRDRDAARVLLTRLHAGHPEIVLVWADNGHGGEELGTWAQDAVGITAKAVPRPEGCEGLRCAAEEVGGGAE